MKDCKEKYKIGINCLKCSQYKLTGKEFSKCEENLGIINNALIGTYRVLVIMPHFRGGGR
jgi:hypothetical protein